MNFIIEKALAKDLNDILDVLRVWNLHHIPSPEADEIDFSRFFVAKVDKKIVGVSGYKLLGNNEGRTRSLAVYPEFQGTGIGKALQDTRLEAMYDEKVKKVYTDIDRPEIVLWYKKNFGYFEVGKRKKRSKHGSLDTEYATMLELDLEQYIKNRSILEKKKTEYINHNDSYPLATYPPLIINVALTGMIPQKRITSHVPISIEEIVEDAVRVHDAGASIVHLHARDKDGFPVSDAQYYEKIITSIRKERPELICCATTSGRGGVDFEARSEVLHINGNGKPDMASLTLGSLNFLTGASINSLETIQRLAQLMKEKNIKPELEVFDSGMVNVAKYLERHNIISGKKYFNILLGNINTAPASLGDLAHIYASLPDDSIWAAAGLGDFQLPMNLASIVAGGHVRVGLEDNMYYDRTHKTLATNRQLVERIVRFANELERPIATPSITRKVIGLS